MKVSERIFGTPAQRTIKKESDALSIPWDMRRTTPLDREEFVVVECYCEGHPHEVHNVPARRLMRGGDLCGKVKVGKVLAALLEEADRG